MVPLTSNSVAEAHDISDEVVKARDEAVAPLGAPVALQVHPKGQEAGSCHAGGRAWGADSQAGMQAGRHAVK